MNTTMAPRVHPAGEGVFEFPTAGGKVRLESTDDVLMPYGGLVPWAAFARRTGIFEGWPRPVRCNAPAPTLAPVYDVVQSFALTALIDRRRFAHVQRLREEPSVMELFAMKAVVGDDTLRRFFAQIDETTAAEWVAHAAQPLWRALPEQVILDWDSTVQPRYGHQEGDQRGYNPTKPGRRSFHPLVAVAAGMRLAVSYHFRAGDTVTATQWEQSMQDAQRWLGERSVWLNRGDLGQKIMVWHEHAGRPRFLFKLKLTANVRRALAATSEGDWQGPDNVGARQVAEGRLRLPDWSAEGRVVFARKLQGVVQAEKSGRLFDEQKHELAVYITNLDATAYNAWQIQTLYRERADAENVFDELKNQWGFSGFCSRKRRVSALASPAALADLQPVEPLRAPVGTAASRRSRRWAPLVFDHRRAPRAERSTKDFAGVGPRRLVATIARRLYPRVRMARDNCAAVENPAPRPDSRCPDSR